MHCTEAGRQLQLYIDGRLSLEQMRLLEEHVAECTACREELAMLEEVSHHLSTMQMVAEPVNLHEQIMQRVAMSAPRSSTQPFSSWRPSLGDLLAAILLATVATLGSVLEQPTLRALLPIGNGHDSLSIVFMHVVHMLTLVDSNTLIFALWIVGTILGIFITLAFAGNEMRSQWFKAMMDRLSTW